MALGKPLIAWGSAEDVASAPWATVGTLSATGGASDPFGGTGAVTLNDTDGAVQAYRYRDVTFSRDGTQYLTLFLKQGTSSLNIAGLFDNTASTVRHQVSITWTAGVPAVTTRAGGGTIFTPISVGSSFWLVRFTADGVVAANTNRIRLFPANNASDTGTLIVYLRNMVLVPVLDNVLRYSRPRAGSEQVQGASGLEDAWTVGTDYYLDADITHIPDRDQESPDNCSGYDGSNPYTGVNCGFDAMLRAGRDKQSLLWVPDRADCSTYLSSYLAQPMEDPPRLATTNANLRALAISLRQSTRMYEGWV